MASGKRDKKLNTNPKILIKNMKMNKNTHIPPSGGMAFWIDRYSIWDEGVGFVRRYGGQQWGKAGRNMKGNVNFRFKKSQFAKGMFFKPFSFEEKGGKTILSR